MGLGPSGLSPEPGHQPGACPVGDFGAPALGLHTAGQTHDDRDCGSVVRATVALCSLHPAIGVGQG